MTATRLDSRAVIRLSPQDEGENVTDFLQGLLTNNVSGELPVYAALLSAQGKTMFDMIVWREGADILLDCEAATADDLVKRLSLYRLRRKIAIARDDSLSVHWSKSDDAHPADPRLPALGTNGDGEVQRGFVGTLGTTTPAGDAVDDQFSAGGQGVPARGLETEAQGIDLHARQLTYLKLDRRDGGGLGAAGPILHDFQDVGDDGHLVHDRIPYRTGGSISRRPAAKPFRICRAARGDRRRADAPAPVLPSGRWASSPKIAPRSFPAQ